MSTNLSLSDVSNPSSASTWLSTLLSAASTLGISATAWQSGGIARTILSAMSWALSAQDGLISLAVQGGFLDYAASGTVTLTNPVTGTTTVQPVTVDPSTLSPSLVGSWVPGWLDILADGGYNCQRITATYAAGNLALTNTQGSSFGPYAAGTYHVASSAISTQTYTNTAQFTINAAQYVGGGVSAATYTTPITVTTVSAHGLTTGNAVTITGALGNLGANGTYLVTVLGTNSFTLTGSAGTGAYTSGGTINLCTLVPFACDQIGTSGTASMGTITSAVTSLVGVSVSNPAQITGTSYESNTALAARCRLKLQSLSTGGPKGAYAFYALSATQYTTLAISAPVTRVTVTATTGAVTTTVTNASANIAGFICAVSGVINNGSGAIRLILGTFSTGSPVTGQTVIVTGTPSTTGANGTWVITRIDGTHIDLQGSVFVTTSGAAGAVQGGDLGIVDSVIQAYAVPLGVTNLTFPASTVSVTVAASVYVPNAQVAAYSAAYAASLASYFSTFPIGGVITDGSATGVLPIGVIEGLLYQAGTFSGAASSVVTGITGLTLNAGTTDIAISAGYVPVQTLAITVVGQ